MLYCNLQVPNTHTHTYLHALICTHNTHTDTPTRYVHILSMYIMYYTNDCGSESIFDAAHRMRLPDSMQTI